MPRLKGQTSDDMSLLKLADWHGATADHLRAHAERLQTVHLKDLFESVENGQERLNAFSMTLEGLHVDFSKQRLDSAAWSDLLAFAQESGLAESIQTLFAGAPINETEGRAVMHMALRGLESDNYEVDGAPVMDEVLAVRKNMLDFAEDVRQRKDIKNVVNIGIGGSDLGPLMVTRALRRHGEDGPKVHFVSNVDPSHLESVLANCQPESTLFLVVSKTFTTQETMTNALAAKAWCVSALGEEAVSDHFAAVSSAPEKAQDFGIPADRVFGFENWVGGRYSMWGPVGLAIACAVGAKAFGDFLAGARNVDQHFSQAPLDKNLPVAMALIGIWNRNFMGFSSHVILPYAQDLERFPAYLQQADMESNGKRTTREGQEVSHVTGPVLWGEPGTNGQHAFYQLLHQGTDIHPVDIIAVKQPLSTLASAGDGHEKLLANAIAQAEALMVGKQAADTPHRIFPGNRPSTFMVLDALDPVHLGMLVALHEHRIFVQGVLWNIFSFDQWGVELGKVLASQILTDWHSDSTKGHDASTDDLMQRLRREV